MRKQANCGRIGTRTRQMQRVMGDHGIVLGYGWGRDLDGPIQDIRDALSYLDRP